MASRLQCGASVMEARILPHDIDGSEGNHGGHHEQQQQQPQPLHDDLEAPLQPSSPSHEGIANGEVDVDANENTAMNVDRSVDVNGNVDVDVEEARDLEVNEGENLANESHVQGTRATAATSPTPEADAPSLSIEELARILGWEPDAEAKMPKAEQRNENKCLRMDDPAGWEYMQTLLHHGMMVMARSIFPAGASDLAHETAAKMIKIGDQSERGAMRENRNVANVLATIIEKSPRRTVQRRVAHAVLVKGFQLKTLTQLRKETGLTLGSSTREQAYQDFKRLANGEVLHRPIIRRIMFKHEVLEAALRFILSSKYLMPLSWGKQKIRLSPTEEVELPLLVRCQPECRIYEDYASQYGSGGEDKAKNAISRSSFYKILARITRGSADEADTSSHVDSWTGYLVDDPCTILEHIIKDFIPEQYKDDREVILNHLNILQNFLKHLFKSHVKEKYDLKEKSVGFHDIDYALAKQDTSDADSSHQGRCNACNFMHLLQNEVSQRIENSGTKSLVAKEDALSALSSVIEKFTLFCAHEVRLLNQQSRVQKLMESLKIEVEKKRGPGQSAIITSSWNHHSLSPASEDEAIYSEGGTLWHTFKCEYYDWVDDAAVKREIYADQILGEPVYNNATYATIGVCLEAFLLQLGKEAPHIKSVILRYDGEANSESINLVLMSSLWNAQGAIVVERVLRFEQGEEEDPMELHFSQCRGQLKRFTKQSVPGKLRSILSPRGLSAALAWNGGVPNSFVQLVVYNKLRLRETCMSFFKLAQALSMRIGRAAEIELSIPEWDRHSLRTARDISMCTSPFQFKVWSHPEVGDGVDMTGVIQSGNLATGDEKIAQVELKDCGFEVLRDDGNTGHGIGVGDFEDGDEIMQDSSASLSSTIVTDQDVQRPADPNDQQQSDIIAHAPPGVDVSQSHVLHHQSVSQELGRQTLEDHLHSQAGQGPSEVDQDEAPRMVEADADYLISIPNESSEANASMNANDNNIGTFNVTMNGNAVTSNSQADLDSDSEDIIDAVHAPSVISGYGSPFLPQYESPNGTQVLKCSPLGALVPVQRSSTMGPGTGEASTAENTNLRKDLIATAVRLTQNLLKNGHLDVRKGDETLQDFNLSGDMLMKKELLLPAGWALRPAFESPFGKNLVSTVQNELHDIFRNPIVSARTIRRDLEEKLPERYSLPGPYELNKEIERNDELKVRTRNFDNDEPQDRPRKRGRPCQIPDIVDHFFQERINAELNVRPRDLISSARRMYSTKEPNAEFPDERKLKQRIAGLKKAWKKRNVSS